ncbi:MAG: hypothetical protein RLZZ387_4516 [Chloroflexota bacterium]|jgi:hypothetical protein
MGYIDETYDISVTEAKAVMQPHLPTLSEGIQQGWAEWSLLAQNKPWLSARARASIVHDAIWAAVKQRFTGVDGTAIVESRGLRVLVLEDHIAIRFKKLDRELRPKNIWTQQQLAFVRQESLVGIPPVTRLTMGYVLTALQNDIEKIAVTLQRVDHLAWAFEIPVARKTVTIATITPANVEPIRERRVRPKKVNENERTDNDQTGAA